MQTFSTISGASAPTIALANSLIANEMIDTLQACQTIRAFRQWLIATAETRQRLPQSELARVERERQRIEPRLEDADRRARARDAQLRFVERCGAFPVSALFLQVYSAVLRHGISPSTFGKRAVSDPRLYEDLRCGRRPGAKVQNRVIDFIDALDAGTVKP